MQGAGGKVLKPLSRQGFCEQERGGATDLAHEGVGDRDEHACTVTRVGLTAAASAVRHAHQHLVGIYHDLTARLALQVRHQAHTAAVLLESGVIEALLLREVADALRKLPVDQRPGGADHMEQRVKRG